MTQATKHTPGPWRYNRDESGLNGYTVNALMPGHEDEYETLAEIAVSEDMTLTQEEAEGMADANARLIAAAPELLEALEWQDMADADPAASRRKGYFDRARELRRAALAKAR